MFIGLLASPALGRAAARMWRTTPAPTGAAPRKRCPSPRRPSAARGRCGTGMRVALYAKAPSCEQDRALRGVGVHVHRHLMCAHERTCRQGG